VKLKNISITARHFGQLVSMAVLVLLTACAKPDPAVMRQTHYDPWEEENREVHAFNRSLDRAVVRPAGKGYTKAVPDDIELVVTRFSENLSLPGAIVNNILQGNGLGATTDTYRFLVNTTLGLGGFFDPATELNMPAKTDADFGQTLYTWGINEGPYMELPVIGPSTRRHTIGRVVDLFTNPLSYAVDSPESYIGTAANIGQRLSDRGRYSDTVDSILYESSDSYAQLRLIYLQNRRFELGQEDPAQEIDPFALETEGF